MDIWAPMILATEHQSFVRCHDNWNEWPLTTSYSA